MSARDVFFVQSRAFGATNSDPGFTPWANVLTPLPRLDWQMGQFVHSCNESVAVSPLDPLRTFIVHFEPRLMNVFIERRYSWETRNFQTESLPIREVSWK